MDQYKVQEWHSVDKFLKRTLQLTLSVSIFSVILCYSSGFSFFPESFNVYFSTFFFSFLSHTLERKYMFLICNGILAFLVKSSVSWSSNSPSAYVGVEVSPSEMKASVPAAETESSLENVALVAKEEAEEEEEEEKKKEQGSLFEEEEEEEERETEGFIAEAKEKEAESGSVVIQEENNAEVEANEDTPSMDELNKKIEEFIRKMKEEIRIEAQQQLIAV